jgi:DNA-binding CsgD family transcriptional regulator/tetratricopeptide (TPR) repeat protein
MHVDAIELEQGRESYESHTWLDGYESLSAASRASPLDAVDLERLATCAYMLGREEEYLALLERAHGAHLDANDPARAVRCAFWIGAHFAQRGDMARAGGWLGRAKRLCERHEPGEVEWGYLLLPSVFEHEARGELELAARVAGEAVAAAERFGDRDLLALGAHMQGHMLIEGGHIREGLALLDEAMVPAAAGELSPIVTGIVYCGVILACRDAHDVRRAREWTEVLWRWCERQPDLVAFTGRCLIHRAEIMQLGGSWSVALEEARRARERCLQGRNEAAAGEASYLQGEVHRLRGEHAAAESAYRDASRRGREPQPGLALLRLAQGERESALNLIRRALAETDRPDKRVALLPTCVEIMLAARELDEARAASLELEQLIDARECAALAATLAHTQGAVELAGADPGAALPPLRRAARAWQRLDAPYEVARARELAGLACRALGDEDGAALELDAARVAYEQLRAKPDLVRLERLGPGAGEKDACGLTERELEVLRLVAAGQTNKEIAAELVLSVRTVDRHVSNIFSKLGVSSRAAAASYAHEHRLV